MIAAASSKPEEGTLRMIRLGGTEFLAIGKGRFSTGFLDHFS